MQCSVVYPPTFALSSNSSYAFNCWSDPLLIWTHPWHINCTVRYYTVQLVCGLSFIGVGPVIKEDQRLNTTLELKPDINTPSAPNPAHRTSVRIVPLMFGCLLALRFYLIHKAFHDILFECLSTPPPLSWGRLPVDQTSFSMTKNGWTDYGVLDSIPLVGDVVISHPHLYPYSYLILFHLISFYLISC